MYIFIDTETTWLPKDYKASYTDFKNWPRIVQFTWLIYDETANLLKEKDYIIKPKWFKIPLSSTAICWISHEFARKNWVELDFVLNEFSKDITLANKIIAHNISFDEAIISVEFLRKWLNIPFEWINKYCTMKAWVDICKITKWRNSYKYPTLCELYYHLFKEDLIWAHNSLVDTKACAKCFFEMNLNNNQLIQTSKIENNKELVFDEVWNRALELMKSNKNIFLTWKAWTWKSTLLRYFLQNRSEDTVVLAPTWVAAINVGWSTIHSFFVLSPTITIDEAIQDWIRAKWKKVYTQIKTIIIDEISMVRADLLDCIDVFLRMARSCDKPFGWVQMIFIWDLYQLPPVVTLREKVFFQTNYKSPYFFDAKVINSNDFEFEYIELQKIYRQSDQKFIDILNAIRNKSINESHIQDLNQRVVWENFEINDWWMYLWWKNAQVEQINYQKLNSIDSKSRVYKAEVHWEFTKNYFPTDQELELKIWAQVMFVANEKNGKRVNWTIWKVIDIKKEFVKVQIYGWELVKVESYMWDIKHYNYDKSTWVLSSKTVWTFLQIPLMLAWAVTIHKSQWKTYDKVIIDLKWWVFAHWQSYVAFSRCTSLEGISLVSPIKLSHVIMDYRVIDFVTKYQYNQSEKKLCFEDKVSLIKLAIKNKQKLEIVYLKAKDEKSKRIILPKSVGNMMYSGKSFVWVSAFCEKAWDDRVFRVDRILEIKVI